MKVIEAIPNHEPSPDGYFRLCGLANLTCGGCGCQVAPEMRGRHRKVCAVSLEAREPIEDMPS